MPLGLLSEGSAYEILQTAKPRTKIPDIFDEENGMHTNRNIQVHRGGNYLLSLNH